RARAAASSRRATRPSAPRGSPAASARAAASISASTAIPSQLSLPFRRFRALTLSRGPPRARGTGGGNGVTAHKTGTRDEWLAARLDLLRAEKEHTRKGDELARRRQELPWVKVEKEYRFETGEGAATLADLFGGRSQLLVYHFMFGPDFAAG